jgi:calcineurin-like phosphoesterase family protein
MTNWFTADLHIGHQNIIRYCNRPFTDVTEMDAALVERWNSAVADGDTVYVLGDFALGNLDDSLAVGAQLRGQKHLVVGNHDRCFRASPGRWERMAQRYVDGAGFIDIHPRTIELKIGGTRVLASHFPYQDDGDDRHLSHRPVDDGTTWLLHGHVHDRWKIRADQRMINVGVDVWGFAPVAEETLTGIIR